MKNLFLTHEKQQGLNSKLTFKCQMCSVSQSVFTCHEEENTSRESEVLINKEVVAGTMLSGNGFTQCKRVFESINVPFIDSKIYRKIQNDSKAVWAETAEIKMKEAIEEEKQIAIQNGDVDKDGQVLLTVVTDGAWSHRSYGSKFSSLSGIATIIGFKSKKVLYYGVKNKYCHICRLNENKGNGIPEHLCNKNHTGPSTKMESDILVEGFKHCFEKYGVIFNNFIADGDSNVHKKFLEAKPYIHTTIQLIR
ncbi:uncharacterized protein LOC129906574 [Episyrphus balteatus]|uniref:uncharacterized protein LOC129906574 n=1 Tax=Episyrphus balteatus TaxID=286459 RepID=UPI002485AF15|nr:uncharacterized protein LOC129906574 [Episyrphus balteatus]